LQVLSGRCKDGRREGRRPVLPGLPIPLPEGKMTQQEFEQIVAALGAMHAYNINGQIYIAANSVVDVLKKHADPGPAPGVSNSAAWPHNQWMPCRDEPNGGSAR
jgi:hypothetical protein